MPTLLTSILNLLTQGFHHSVGGFWLRSFYQEDDKPERPHDPPLNCFSSSISVLNTESTPRVFPPDGPIDAGDLAGSTFQATSKFRHHLSFLVKRVKVGRAGINTEPFFAGLADFLIERDMSLFIIFKSIQSQLLGDLHHASAIPIKLF
jgi:hypothetical protein